MPPARGRQDHHRPDRGGRAPARAHGDPVHHRVQGGSPRRVPETQARMGPHPHRAPERPAGPGAGDKPGHSTGVPCHFFVILAPHQVRGKLRRGSTCGPWQGRALAA